MKWWPRSWRQFWSTLDGRTYHLMLSARPWLGWLAVGSMVVVFALVFWWVPLEAIQGYPQKIFYIHVPSAWVMYAAFAVVFAASILYLWKRTSLWDIFARCAAEVGFLFTTLALATAGFFNTPVDLFVDAGGVSLSGAGLVDGFGADERPPARLPQAARLHVEPGRLAPRQDRSDDPAARAERLGAGHEDARQVDRSAVSHGDPTVPRSSSSPRPHRRRGRSGHRVACE